MKYGKYYVTGLIVLLLAGGGTGLAINHNNSTKQVETHKNLKSSSSSSHKTKKHSAKKSSSKSSSKSSNSSSEMSPSQQQVSSSSVTSDTADSGVDDGQPTSNTTLTAFLNKYGITPAQWLVQNKGMSVEDALYATPDEQETSGELQSEWAYKQGTHDSMVSSNTGDDMSQSNDDDTNAYSDDPDNYQDSDN